MGIPSFYRWLIENFPKVLENNLNGEIIFNNLYIDMNGVVHNAIKLDSSSTITKAATTTQTSKDKETVLMLKSELSDEKLKERIFYRLDQMVNNVNPSSLLYIGVDGVPPRAKAIEQRKRRFKSSKESVDVIIKALKSKNQPITRDSIMDQFSKIFDSNAISPATEFIKKVDDWIKEYCKQLSLKRENLTIILSDSTVPGEGEHKIMDYIRQNHPILEKDGVSHCFYGMDADLIFLGLESHLSNFYILRDPISLISCSICKAIDDHSNYECRSAVALKKQFQKKSTSVSVRGIPNQCSENDIKQLFSYYGNIKIQKIEKSNTKNKTLNAYIDFENEDIVNEVSTRGSTFTINNEKVSIHVEYLDDIFKPKNEKGEIIKDEDEEQETLTNEKTNNNNIELSAEEIAKKQEQDEFIPENAVFIVGLDSTVSKFDVITFFEKFGKINTFQLQPSPRFHKQQFAMIKYETQEAAQLACKSTGIEFFGTIITIKRAQLPKPEGTGSSSNSGGGVSGTKTSALTEDEKQAKERVKEKKRMIKDSKIEQLLTKLDPNTPKDVSVFYLGLSSWNVERAFENYLLFDKAGLEHTVLKDNINSDGKKKKILFDYINIDKFRTYLEYYFFEKTEKSKREKINFNRVINDFTVLCFYLGNDFLPHLPSVGIQSGSIELIMSWYRDWIRSSLNDTNSNDDIKYIVNEQSTHLNFENCLPLLESLADWESFLYPDNLEKQVKKDFIKVNKTTTESIIPDFKYDDLLYYRVKFDLIGKPDEEVIKLVDDMCYQYTLGLHWVLRYYVSGCQGWDWYYPYHYAPLAKDLLNYQKRLSKIQDREMVNKQFNFKLSSPLPPLIHLASVLPRNSCSFLPDSMKHIMDGSSPFTDSYRDDYKYDFNGENVAWKAIVLLDFMDIEKFKEYLLPIVTNQLSDEEKIRNTFGNDVKYKNGEIIEISSHKQSTIGSINEKEYTSINNGLTIKDLSYPTRNYFTRSPHPAIDSSYISIPTQQAPTTDHNQLASLSKDQIDFLEWRKSKTGFNQSLEILHSIDFSKSSCFNIDKKQTTQCGGSITSWLGRVLNNEISKDSSIFIQSIDDSQLIINIGFKQPVKLSSINVISSSNRVIDRESVPKIIKIYTNNDQPNIDFSVIQTQTPKCTIEYSSPSELESYSTSKSFTFGNFNQHFKSVNNLTIFIESNFSKNQDKISIVEKIILS
ncbi:hypothetical protein RB653_009126 [Dictyostelium firmibasis]|uniref:Uncharacterized protein n=1 Tax=Dictyostelium firmibasis TaxID=79012 RepID=A0AAN7U188_9MYCE